MTVTNKAKSDLERYEKYKELIELLRQRKQINPQEIKHVCSQESPALVTRTLNELLNQGWLIKESDSSYAWNGSREFVSSNWLDEKIFGSQVKMAPEGERPREKLLGKGVEALTNAELIAILIRSGRPGESAVQAGQKVGRVFDHRMGDLPAAGRMELKAISSAVEKTAYCQIMAGIELGRRVSDASQNRDTWKITSSEDAIRFCQQRFQRLISDGKQEEFHIVSLDTKNQVIDSHQITVGTLDASLVHPREVFRAAIRDAAASVLLVHNHPSGDPTPSKEDIAVTERLTECGQLIGIEVLDHIVLGSTDAVSVRSCR